MGGGGGAEEGGGARQDCGCSMCTIKKGGRCHIFGEAKSDARGRCPAFR